MIRNLFPPKRPPTTPTPPPCPHYRKYGRTLVEGHIVCGACKQTIPFPMATARCGHHGQRFSDEEDREVCGECGTILQPGTP